MPSFPANGGQLQQPLPMKNQKTHIMHRRSGERHQRLLASFASIAFTAIAQGQSPPATFSRTYTHASGSITVNYSLHSVRGSNYEVYVHSGGTTYSTYTPTRPARTYLGTVTGYPGAVAAGQLLSNGDVRTAIFFEDGTTWRGIGTSMSIPSPAWWTPNYPTAIPGAGGAGSTVYGAQLGLDLTYTYYNKAGQNLDETLERAEWAVMDANAIYLRDAAIVHKIGRVVIRTNSGDDRSTSLDLARDEWNNVMPLSLPAATYDLTGSVVVTGSGGLAYVGAIGTSNRYSWNSISSSSTDGNFAVVWRHEAGHNWGSGHDAGGKPEGGTIMSGNGLSRFSSGELASIISHRNTKTGILDNLGSYSLPLPPRANADRGKAHFTLSPLTLDVLANDSDSNGQSLVIQSFQSTSQRGGSITRSVGTGPGGRDQLIYTPPTTTQLDWFNYRIQDSAGYQSVGWVMIQPADQAPDPDTVADVVSDATGLWSTATNWSDDLAPASGKHYAVSTGNTIDSSPNSGTSATFAGDSIAVESGGTLRLAHTSSGGTTTQSLDLNGVILRNGSGLQSYNTAAGNVWRNLNSPVVIAPGTATIRIQSDSGSAYSNGLRLNSGIFGTGNVNLTGSLQGQTGERRFLYMALPNVAYSGNWNVAGDNTTDNARRLFLVTEAANSLGTGFVTLNTRAQLRNSAIGGLDSLWGVTLTTATSTLQLSQPWNGPGAKLDVQAGTVDLGSGANTLGSLTIAGNAILPGVWDAASLNALGYGPTFSGTGTITLVTISSIASGDWNSTAIWNDGLAPGTGRNHRVAASTTVNSESAAVANGGTVTFPGDWITVANGGTLRLRHTSAGGNNTHTVNLKELLLENGAALQSYNTAQGNVTRNLSNPITFGDSGSVTIRIQSDNGSAYTNALRLNGDIDGGSDINLTGSLQGQTGERRLLYVNAANTGFNGDWTVAGDGTTDNARRLYLVSEEPDALGSGTVTLNTRAQLRNSVANGLDSVSGVTLTTSTSTLQLSSPWVNSVAVLTLTAGTLDLGSGTSTIGTMTVAGNTVPPGTYNAAGLGALGFGGTFSGTGSLVVTGDLP